MKRLLPLLALLLTLCACAGEDAAETAEIGRAHV